MASEESRRTADDPAPGSGPGADADLDRLVARSLAASERGSREAAAPSPSRSPWPWLLAALLFALLLGMIANPWFERQVRAILPADLQELPPVAIAPVAAPVPDLSSWNDRVAALEQSMRESQALAQAQAGAGSPGDPAGRAEQLASLEGRLSALESVAVRLQSTDVAATERLDRLVADVAAISGDSSAQQEQVRELLLVTAVRRLFQRGRMLGPLMPAVEARFAIRDPDAVDALSAWNGAPVTRQSLATRLDGSVVAQPPTATDGWWQSLKRRLSGIVQVREAGTAPEAATITAAQEALLGGDLDQAIARMAAAPATADGNAWLADARRLQAAESAVERMELATTDGLVQLSSSAATSGAAAPADAPAAPPAGGQPVRAP